MHAKMLSLPATAVSALAMLRTAAERYRTDPEYVQAMLDNSWARLAEELLKHMDKFDRQTLMAVNFVTEYFAEHGDWNRMYDNSLRNAARAVGMPHELLHMIVASFDPIVDKLIKEKPSEADLHEWLLNYMRNKDGKA